jgi:hypothetical protein
MSLKKEENIKQAKLIREHGANGVLTQKCRNLGFSMRALSVIFTLADRGKV